MLHLATSLASLTVLDMMAKIAASFFRPATLAVDLQQLPARCQQHPPQCKGMSHTPLSTRLTKSHSISTLSDAQIDALLDTEIEDRVADFAARYHDRFYHRSLHKIETEEDCGETFLHQRFISDAGSLEAFRMPKETFQRLSKDLQERGKLKSSRAASAGQKLAIFLTICAHAQTLKLAGHIYGHSASQCGR